MYEPKGGGSIESAGPVGPSTTALTVKNGELSQWVHIDSFSKSPDSAGVQLSMDKQFLGFLTLELPRCLGFEPQRLRGVFYRISRGLK